MLSMTAVRCCWTRIVMPSWFRSDHAFGVGTAKTVVLLNEPQESPSLNTTLPLGELKIFAFAYAADGSREFLGRVTDLFSPTACRAGSVSVKKRVVNVAVSSATDTPVERVAVADAIVSDALSSTDS